MPAAQYVTRPIVVEALHYMGEKMKEEAIEFIGKKEGRSVYFDKIDGSIHVNSSGSIFPGMWIVRWGEPGNYNIRGLGNKTFLACHEPAI